MKATVIGAGLAGCEAAWQLAKRQIEVELIDMKPQKRTPACKTDYFAELVCSNSLRSDSLNNAVGVLKEEMRMNDSLIMKAADATRLPAGSALAVDREGFSKMITETILNHPLIHFVTKEVDEIPSGPCIIATGPLTSDVMADAIKELIHEDTFYFYDAAAPIVEKESIDFSKAYLKSRYDKGEADYINCPMNEEEFFAFYQAVLEADKVEIKEFEKEIYFEGCMPFEEMARRGMKTLLFGPMKPVGLEKDGVRPYAVVQLRQDDAAATLYNIVGFQTHLTWPAQRKVISMIPGLENASIVRYGVMHRNTYINSPLVLRPTYQFKERDDLFFAGQMTGVEGYVESAASGLLAGINLAKIMSGKEAVVLPDTCMMGAMAHYITHTSSTNFQPMNANFGIMRLEKNVKKHERKEAYGKQALEVMKSYMGEIGNG